MCYEIVMRDTNNEHWMVRLRIQYAITLWWYDEWLLSSSASLYNLTECYSGPSNGRKGGFSNLPLKGPSVEEETRAAPTMMNGHHYCCSSVYLLLCNSGKWGVNGKKEVYSLRHSSSYLSFRTSVDTTEYAGDAILIRTPLSALITISLEVLYQLILLLVLYSEFY